MNLQERISVSVQFSSCLAHKKQFVEKIVAGDKIRIPYETRNKENPYEFQEGLEHLRPNEQKFNIVFNEI